MLVHNIVDVSPLYHRFAYRMRNTPGGNTEIPIMYFVLKEIEAMRENIERSGNSVMTSACFDSKSARKTLLMSGVTSEYKAGRKSILTEQDFIDIEMMQQIMKDAGINVFKADGCEADDIIAHLANDSSYGFRIIYTSDKDMMANIRDNVGMRRYTNGTWYSIDRNNFESVSECSFKVKVPFNTIGLYLSTVGDSADKIPGIKGFGKKAFDGLVLNMSKSGYKFFDMYDYNNTEDAIVSILKDNLISEDMFRQCVDSFNIVRPVEICEDEAFKGGILVEGGNNRIYGFKKIKAYMKEKSVMQIETIGRRKQAYMSAGMPSLAK